MNRPLAKLTITIFSLFLFLHDDAKGSDDFSDFVQNSLAKAYRVRAQKLKVDNATAAKWNAWTALLPTLKASGGRITSDTESYSSSATSKTRAAYNTLSVGASWVLWDGFSSVTNIRTSLIDLESEKTQAHKEEQEHVLMLLENLLELEVLTVKLKTTERLLEESKWVLNEAKELVRLGAKSALDVIDAELQANNAERDLKETIANVKSLERSLRAQFSIGPENPIPTIDLSNFQPYFFSRFEAALKAAKTSSIDSLPPDISTDVKLSELSLAKASADLLQTRLSYGPKFTLTLARDWDLSGYANNQSPSYVSKPLVSNSLTISASWVLWDWLSTHRSVQTAGRNFEIEEIRLKETVEKERAALSGYVEQYEISEMSVAASLVSLEKAEKQVEYAKIMFRAGRLGLLNFQQANSRLYEARLALFERLKNKFTLAARILYHLGGNLLPD